MSGRIPVSILGATGVVGQRIVRRLAAHRQFEIAALAASERSVGKRYAEAVHWQEEELPASVRDLRVVPCSPEAAGAPIVLSALNLFGDERLGARHAVAAIALAYGANVAFKLGVVLWYDRRLGSRVLLPMLATVAGGAAAYAARI